MMDPFRYLRHKQKALHETVTGIPKIYFDMNYWIDFTRHLAGRTERREIPEILEISRDLASRNKAVFPISDIHLFEMFKRSDRKGFEELLSLANDISNGLCFCPRDRRIENEIVFAIRILFEIPNALKLRDQQTWTRPFFCFTEQLPLLDPIPQDSRQASFTDFAWTRSLSQVYLADDDTRVKLNPSAFERDLVGFLQAGRDEHTDESLDMTELIRIEIGGQIALYQDSIDQMLRDFFEGYERGSSVIADAFAEVDPDEQTPRLLYLLVDTATRESDYRLLPDIMIGGCLHALKRRDRQSKYDKNDAFDFMHARVALPYCDYFFCEKGLAGLIHNPRMGLDRQFDCAVRSKPHDVLAILREDF